MPVVAEQVVVAAVVAVEDSVVEAAEAVATGDSHFLEIFKEGELLGFGTYHQDRGY